MKIIYTIYHKNKDKNNVLEFNNDAEARNKMAELKENPKCASAILFTDYNIVEEEYRNENIARLFANMEM